MSHFPYDSYPYRGNDTRFGPLLPFVGGLLVGGLFAPRPNFSYGPFNNTPPMNMGPAMPNYPAAPYYPSPSPTPYMMPYGPTPAPYYMEQNIPTYYASVNAENVDIYPTYQTPSSYE